MQNRCCIKNFGIPPNRFNNNNLLWEMCSYHSYAFIACRSIHTVNKLNPSFVYPLLEKFFKYQVLSLSSFMHM